MVYRIFVAMKIKYFPGLNGLRFVAAVLVFLHHVEQHKYWMNIPNLWGNAIIDNIGHQARIIFFVLSGFLITYLFLREKEKTGKINWWRFQTRRALRLWPVYYLMVFIAMVILPKFISIGNFNETLAANFEKQAVIYLLLFPNLARLLPPIMGANQFWSVGVQEQFYWLWPLVVRFFDRLLVPFCLVFVGLKITGEWGLNEYLQQLTEGTATHTRVMQIIKMWELLLFEQMAVGALGAYWVFHQKQKILNFLFSRKTLAVVLILFVASLFVHLHIIGYTACQGALALIIILNISLNDKFPVSLENKWLDYMGKLSFGMYAYHTAVISVVITVLSGWGYITENTVLFNGMLYLLSLALTVGISALSYKYLEGYFLKLKDRFRSNKKKEQNAVAVNWEKSPELSKAV